MTDPCRYCVAPERYPGCHDHCEKLKAHRESDEYKKLCEYKNTYLKSHSTASSTQINKAMRYFKYKGYSLYGFRIVKNYRHFSRQFFSLITYYIN